MKKAPKQIEGRRIRVGVVGCGRIAANHFKAIEAHKDNLQLVAVCDTDHAALESAQKQYHVTGFNSLHEMLAKSDVDLVALCTPSGLHPSQTILAAQAGRHVMTEKPMATRWSDGLRMVRACDEADVHLLVIKQNRRNATLAVADRDWSHSACAELGRTRESRDENPPAQRCVGHRRGARCCGPGATCIDEPATDVIASAANGSRPRVLRPPATTSRARRRHRRSKAGRSRQGVELEWHAVGAGDGSRPARPCQCRCRLRCRSRKGCRRRRFTQGDGWRRVGSRRRHLGRRSGRLETNRRHRSTRPSIAGGRQPRRHFDVRRDSRGPVWCVACRYMGPAKRHLEARLNRWTTWPRPDGACLRQQTPASSTVRRRQRAARTQSTTNVLQRHLDVGR